MKIYLEIIGKIFSGKETIFQIIKEMVEDTDRKHRVAIHRFSDPLNECLEALALPKERDYQQRISTVLRREFGESLLGNALVQRVLVEKAYIVCLDGIRRPQDTIYLRNLPNSHVICVDTPVEIRLERAKKRIDRPVDTIDDLLKQQSVEADSKIDEISRDAEFVLDNSGDLEHLKLQIRRLLIGLNIEVGGK